jgi:threonyl-tRNA synthetase
MRLLIFHVDSFTCTVTEKGRSPLIETPTAPASHIDDGLLVLASAEAGDERDLSGVARRAADEVARLAGQLKAGDVLLLPFAHLFAEPCPPEVALRLIDAMGGDLRAQGLAVQRPPFGWFHTWDLKAKGHPMSRVARTIAPAPVSE